MVDIYEQKMYTKLSVRLQSLFLLSKEVSMGRSSFGLDNFMKVILEVTGKTGQLENPLETLRYELQQRGVTLGEGSIRKYLHELRDSGHLAFEYAKNERGCPLQRIKIIKAEISPVKSEPKKMDPKAVATNAQTNRLVAALVDYDNVCSSAKFAGIQLSFAKLKDLPRKYGRVLFAEAFVSPASNNGQTITTLWNTGWEVILCPYASKDKDAVDAKMKDKARKLLEHTTVTTVIIMSRDTDFRDLADVAADMHKEVIFVDITKERDAVTGYDVLPQLPQSRQRSKFANAIQHLTQGSNGSSLNSEEEQAVRFIKDYIRELADRENREGELKLAFEPLKKCVWFGRPNGRGLRRLGWDGIVSWEEISAAQGALVETFVLKKIQGSTFTYYVLNRDNRAFINALVGLRNLLEITSPKAVPQGRDRFFYYFEPLTFLFCLL